MVSLSPSLVAVVVAAVAAGATVGYLVARLRTWNDIRAARRDALDRGRHTLRGQVAEQLAPLAPTFPYAPGDARFLGAPIDYVVFDGLGDPAEEVEIVLVEVKTGRAKLSPNEKRVEAAVKAGRVHFEVLRL